MSTWFCWISCSATCPALVGLDWLSWVTMLILYVFLPILIPFLNDWVRLIWLSTYSSPEANPASWPVSGVMKPIVMVPVLDAVPVPLSPEPQALRNPPAPTASAPAPAPLSKERRAIG